jgi:hypothetical protein
MMFSADVVASDTVEIIRIASEDAERLMSDLQQRRKKLKGLAVADFGAFLDRDWRVSDLLGDASMPRNDSSRRCCRGENLSKFAIN